MRWLAGGGQDPAAALIMVPIIVKEGIEGLAFSPYSIRFDPHNNRPKGNNSPN